MNSFCMHDYLAMRYEQQFFFIQDMCPSCVQVHVLQSPPPSNIQVTEDLIN